MPEARSTSGEWVSAALLREAIRRLHRAWTRLPARATRVWWGTLAVGLALTLALTVASVTLVRGLESAGRLGWEPAVVRWFDRSAPISFNTAMWIEAPANGFILWALVLYCAGLAAWRGLPLLSVTFLTGHTLVYFPILLGWLLWDRDRPTLIAAGIGTPPGFNSFPSGHLVQAVFVYGLLTALWTRAARGRAERAFAALCFLLLLAVVSVGRLRLGAHWPTDLAAALPIGALWLAACLVALRRAGRATSPHA